MSASAGMAGNGTTIGLAVGTATTFTTLAEVRDCTGMGLTVAKVDLTSLTSDSNAKEYTFGDTDPQEMTLTCTYTDAGWVTVNTNLRALRTVKVSYIDGSYQTATGFVSSLGGPKVGIDDAVTFDMGIQLTGVITPTTAA